MHKIDKENFTPSSLQHEQSLPSKQACLLLSELIFTYFIFYYFLLKGMLCRNAKAEAAKNFEGCFNLKAGMKSVSNF